MREEDFSEPLLADCAPVSTSAAAALSIWPSATPQPSANTTDACVSPRGNGDLQAGRGLHGLRAVSRRSPLPAPPPSRRPDGCEGSMVEYVPRCLTELRAATRGVRLQLVAPSPDEGPGTRDAGCPVPGQPVCWPWAQCLHRWRRTAKAAHFPPVSHAQQPSGAHHGLGLRSRGVQSAEGGGIQPSPGPSRGTPKVWSSHMRS